MKAFIFATFIISMNKHAFTFELSTELYQQLNIFDSISFSTLVENCGYTSEEYKVTTEDGYILGLFRVRGTRGWPILLMHGIADASDTFVINGNTSIGITLAGQGYDLWFGNIRGNKYSRRHIKLNPDVDASFWDFSLQEFGYYDLPATIDTILNHTGFEKINVFGHSQGNAIFYVLGSTRPDYNKKINLMTALAPICFVNNPPEPLSTLIQLSPLFDVYAKKFGVNELYGDNSTSGKITRVICENRIFGYAICGLAGVFPILGFDVSQITRPIFYEAFKYYPAGTSWKSLYHFSQISRSGRFAKYDYGVKRNLLEYNSTIPPDYDLEKVIMPVILLAGRNDRIALIPDVDLLYDRLPNVINYTIVKRKLMTHLDFVWGKDMATYLFPYIFNILKQFS